MIKLSIILNFYTFKFKIQNIELFKNINLYKKCTFFNKLFYFGISIFMI